MLSSTRSAALFDTATDSYGALPMCLTKCINYDNVLNFNAVWISCRANVAPKSNLIQLGSAHEWSGVWTGPKRLEKPLVKTRPLFFRSCQVLIYWLSVEVSLERMRPMRTIESFFSLTRSLLFFSWHDCMFTEGNDVECTTWFFYAVELTAICMEPVYMEVGDRALVNVCPWEVTLFFNYYYYCYYFNLFSSINMRLFGSSSRATLSSAILIFAISIAQISIWIWSNALYQFQRAQLNEVGLKEPCCRLGAQPLNTIHIWPRSSTAPQPDGLDWE